MNESWKSDPRLKNMDGKKLSLLLSFAKELEEAPEDGKVNAFLSINRRAAEAHVNFSPAERELLLTILTEGLSPKEKARVQLIRSLTEKMQNGKR